MATHTTAAILLTSLALLCVPGSASAEHIDAAADLQDCVPSVTMVASQSAQTIGCILEASTSFPCIWVDLTKSPPTITPSLNCI